MRLRDIYPLSKGRKISELTSYTTTKEFANLARELTSRYTQPSQLLFDIQENSAVAYRTYI